MCLNLIFTGAWLTAKAKLVGQEEEEEEELDEMMLEDSEENLRLALLGQTAGDWIAVAASALSGSSSSSNA
jgi:hypothetical protein